MTPPKGPVQYDYARTYHVSSTVAAVMARFQDRLSMSLAYLQQHPKATARELFTFHDAEEADRYYSNRSEVEKKRKVKKQQEQREKEEAAKVRAIELIAARQVALEEQAKYPWLTTLKALGEDLRELRREVARLASITEVKQVPKMQKVPSYTFQLNRLMKDRRYFAVFGACVANFIDAMQEEGRDADEHMEEAVSYAHGWAVAACDAGRPWKETDAPPKPKGTEGYDRKKKEHS